MLPHRVGVDLGAMAMKGYSAFPKAPALLETHHQFSVISGHSLGVGSYHSAEVQSVYFIVPANWAKIGCDKCSIVDTSVAISHLIKAVSIYT